MRGLTYDDKFLMISWDKMKHWGVHYLYPSQITWLKWLRNQGGLEISRRTLCRYFRNLQNRQIINRIRRVKRSRHGGLEFNTTLYSIGFLGLMHLKNIGHITWNELREFIKNSTPFRARVPKKQKKGITPTDPGFYKEFKSIGSLVPDLIK